MPRLLLISGLGKAVREGDVVQNGQRSSSVARR